jgi:prevent-host-death family protein
MEKTTPESMPIPPRYAELVKQWGPPVGVEEARTRWGQIVAAAETGTVTLVTAETAAGPAVRAWAAVVPVGEVADPGRHPVWTLSEARPKLGDVVARATALTDAAPQILTRHRRPVAAVVAAVTLVDLPAAGDRIAFDELLHDGGTVTLAFDPGQEGAMDAEGGVLQDPADPCYTATARDAAGDEIGWGSGDTVADVLLRLWRPPADYYSEEPPF